MLTGGLVAAAGGLLGTVAAVPAVTAVAAPTRTLTGSMPAWAHSSALQGAVPAADHVGFRVYLGWRSDPSAFDRAVSTPGNAQYGHYLTAAQFRAAFSPSQSQVTAVQRWLHGQGFTIDYTPSNNLYVAAEGTVAQANAAFGTTLGEYSYHGLTLRSPESDLTVPGSLSVQAVVGLDDSAELVHTDHVTSDATPSPAFVNGGTCSTYYGQYNTGNATEPTPLHTTTGVITSPTGVKLPPAYQDGNATPYAPCGYTPAQLRGAYGLTAAQTGAGQTVAIIDAYASPTIVPDANRFFTDNNVSKTDGSAIPGGTSDALIPPLSATNFSQVVAPGTFRHPEEGATQDPQGWYGEETLDVEAVHSMAPAAHIVYVGAPNNFQDLDAALNHVVDRQLASMVTNSYGNSGEALPNGYIKPVYDVTQQAVAEGIGVYFSSGDNGDETGGVGGLAQATPDWPASDPWVTAVGGTALAVDEHNTRSAEYGWETGRSKLAGSSADALSWTPTPPGTYLYGSGGGTSRLFAQPAYQANVVPTTMSEIYGNSTPMRVVPDVAAIGDPNTGMLVGQTQTFPSGVAYGTYRIGGTSVASPIFTGMMADVQQARGSDIGFANPLLYQAYGSSAFKDIAPVNQSAPPAVVRSDYANFLDSSAGYVASVRTLDFDAPLTIHVATGYDDVTGVGSPGPDFFTALAK